MDIIISDNWLRDYLKTKATPSQIGEYLSLSGPSVEKIEKDGKDSIYHIEVTTNRVDSASVYGIAREASAILPRFGIKADFEEISLKNLKLVKKSKYLKALVDTTLCVRFTALLFKNVKITDSPQLLKDRLTKVGERPINSVVDISNYLMYDLGCPVHAFDYDLIHGKQMTLRASRKNEEITTLDGKTYKLKGEDIVIEDGDGRLIDLAGIMGCKNSMVTKETKNVLLLIPVYNPKVIRKTSMELPKRTNAATIFEKGIDTQLSTVGAIKAIELFKKYTQASVESEILDIYPKPYKPKSVTSSLDYISKVIGVNVTKNEVTTFLTPLGFKIKWKASSLTVEVPSHRSKDISIPEDIVEEVARIYGYHNIPSSVMSGEIPVSGKEKNLQFESELKELLVRLKAIEVYTLSLVSKDETNSTSLKVKNPLGTESEFLRESLCPSLVKALSENLKLKRPIHLFEIANVYLPRKNDLPNEVSTLAGIFTMYSYREAKGIIEELLNSLNINALWSVIDTPFYHRGHRVELSIDGEVIGEFGVLKNDMIYYEFKTQVLQKYKGQKTFESPPKYPSQIEDITFILKANTLIGDVIKTIKSVGNEIKNIEYIGTYNNFHTFRIFYQHQDKTLLNAEVEKLRAKIISSVKKKHEGVVKD